MQVFLGTILVYYYNCIPLDIFDKKNLHFKKYNKLFCCQASVSDPC